MIFFPNKKNAVIQIDNLSISKVNYVSRKTDAGVHSKLQNMMRFVIERIVSCYRVGDITLSVLHEASLITLSLLMLAIVSERFLTNKGYVGDSQESPSWWTPLVLLPLMDLLLNWIIHSQAACWWRKGSMTLRWADSCYQELTCRSSSATTRHWVNITLITRTILHNMNS